MSEIETLLKIVKLHPVGSIDRNTSAGKGVFDALVDAWPNLPGSDDQSTFAEKLWRAEKLEWKPPLITFRLERHGGTVNGSTRADLHCWEVDVEKGKARIARQTYRQLERSAARLDCAALARDIVAVIEAGNKHEGLIWADGMQSVTIKIGVLIPETIQATTTARRSRFRNALIHLMAEHGWGFLPKGNVMRFAHPKSTAKKTA